MDSILLPLKQADGRLLAEVGTHWFLLDTGAHCSFGTAGEFGILGDVYPTEDYYRDLTAAKLSQRLGVEVSGLIGMDILGQYDAVFNPMDGHLRLSKGELDETGFLVPMDFFTGLPIVHGEFGGSSMRCFIGSGQRLSYLQHPLLQQLPQLPEDTDFHIGHGALRTPVHSATLSLGDCSLTMRTGYLPEVVSTELLLSAANGILGCELFLGRMTGFFPRRELLVLGHPVG